MTTLLESKAKPYGSKKGAVVSVALHGALIAAFVAVSGAVALPDREKIEEHSVLYVTPQPPKVHVAPEPLPEVKKPPAAKRPEPARVRAPAPPRPVPRQIAVPSETRVATPTAPVIAPINVPTSIPAVDLKGLPSASDVRIPEPTRALPVGGGSSRSDGDVETKSRGGLGSGVDPNKAYSENQVERAVQMTRPAVPRYPDALKSVSVQGDVIVQYIVDARGRVEPGSIRILSTSHKLFADAVRSALLDARFRPAQVGGRSVRQLVEQPFVFKLTQ